MKLVIDAINCLKSELLAYEQTNEEFKISRNPYPINIDKTVENFKAAISVLEKQVAKKPVNLFVNGNDKDDYCPECGNFIDCRFAYCECGQKLDWSVDNE